MLEPEVQHFALDGPLSRLVNEYRSEAEAKGLELRWAPSHVVVRSDPALLERILRNYLSNSVRYTEHGEIRVECVPDREHVRIDVIDSGIGIPVSQQGAIFDEFHRLGNPERERTKGLGLGLAIVDRVARLLDHPIAVESEPGRGARFSLTVPLGDRTRTAAQSAMTSSDRRGDLAGLCLVVVDDDLRVREGMSTLLRQWGCEVIAAGSEEDALERIAQAPAAPDVIIADYQLRGERTGVEAIARLRRELGSEVPARIITGDTSAERLREANASGHPLVHKPVQPAVLRTFLRNARNEQRLPSKKP